MQTLVPLANRLTHLANPLSAADQLGEAKHALETSLEILRDNYGPNSMCVSGVLASLSAVDKKLGDSAAALQESTEAQRIREQNATVPWQVRRVGAGIAAPRVESKMDPQYTDQARAAHLSGTVLLSVVVETDGAAKDIQVQIPLGMGLDEAAINAVQQWKFAPAVMQADGQPVPVRATIEVNFRLL